MLVRLFSGLSFRLQSVAVFLSLVGVFFGVKTFIHIRDELGSEKAESFLVDLYVQLGAALVVNCIVAYFLYLIATKPIRNLGNVMKRLAEGDLEINVPYTNSRTEIGFMARCLNVFKKNAVEKIDMERQQHEKEARFRQEKQDAMQQLARDFEKEVKGIVNQVASAATQLTGAAKAMTETVSVSSTSATNAFSVSEQTSGSVRNVAEATDQLSDSVREISAQLQKTNLMVRDSVAKADGADVHANALTNASEKINEVMEIISSIASQINLLSLNATIEAARAGEAGKGFSVVANEVKALANQTDKSVQEIRAVIEEMKSASDDIFHALKGIKDSVSHIAEAAGSVASAVEEQSATTSEIASNMQAAANGSKIIAESLNSVRTSSVNASSASEQMFTSTKDLTKQADELNRQVDAFLSKIRAA
jgi:methyl-accepting chemotaxis protein